jgi:hypothetical protein
MLTALDAKRLDLLHHAVPKAKKVAVLIHDRALFELQLPPVREVARKAGLELLVVNTQDSDRGYEGAFETIARPALGRCSSWGARTSRAIAS